MLICNHHQVIRHEELNEMLLNDPQMFDAFFEYVQLSTFDVASDAFATFKVRANMDGQRCDERRGKERTMSAGLGCDI